MGTSEDSPPLPLQQKEQGGDCPVHTDHPLNSTPHIRHHFPSPRTHGMRSLASSSTARMKPRRTSPTSSSSPSSSSSSSWSSDSLAPSSIDFKRSCHRQQRSRSPALVSLKSAPFREQIDDCQVSVTEIAPATVEALRFCPHQLPFSVRSTNPPLQEDMTHPMHTFGMHFEDIAKRADLEKEEHTRKLKMWHTACAMAHAYIHQLDVHQHEQHHRHEMHQSELHERSKQHDVCIGSKDGSHQQEEVRDVPSKQHDACIGSKDGPHQQEELCNVQSTQLSNSTHHLAPLPPIKSSHSDDMRQSSSVCLLNDVVCIDEVVNPTQAAEWFGALFLSTSTLVS